MASEVVAEPVAEILPAELHPKVDHLVTEDDTPVDNVFSEKQQRLLTEPLYSSWAKPEEGRSFVVMANVGLFYAVRKPPFVPDVLLSLGVDVPADLWEKPNRSYFLWEYGKAPDVVIEVVSNREGGEDSQKLAGYARIAVRYYVIYDPERLLSNDVLRAYKLAGMNYHAMEDASLLPELGLGLRIWQGAYEDHDNTWLRWVDAAGELIPTGRERAEQQQRLAEQQQRLAEQQQRLAEQQQQRAVEQQQRADRLAEQLRRLGVEPEV